MSDSNAPDRRSETIDRDREQRLERIKRWVAYIQSAPPETWGPQQNAIVNDQLDAAQSISQSAAHHQHVREVAAEIAEASDESDTDSG